MDSYTHTHTQLGVYKWVVDDVMKNVREDFLNEGADTQVLEDLKQVCVVTLNSIKQCLFSLSLSLSLLVVGK